MAFSVVENIDLEFEAATLVTVILEPHKLKILAKLAFAPGTSVTELAKSLGDKVDLVSWHLAKLRHYGVVVGVRDGQSTRYRFTKLGELLVGEIRKFFVAVDAIYTNCLNQQRLERERRRAERASEVPLAERTTDVRYADHDLDHPDDAA